MNVLLVNPPAPLNERYFATPPLGLMCLASTLRLHGHQVKILDLFSFGNDIKNVSDILNREHFDVVGITGMSFQHNTILKTAEVCKIADKDLVVAVGGPHASAFPSLLLDDPNIDFVLRGEADNSFPCFVDALNDPINLKDIPGLCFKTDSGSHLSSAHIIQDVDSLPIPAWDLIDITKYVGNHHGFFYEKEPVGKIISSRGCPYPCTFCAAHAVHSKVWRPQSSERIISEIDYLVNEVGIQELHIEDDNFTLDLNRAKTILKEIIRREYNLAINFPNGIRMDRIDDELLTLMKQSGVYSVTFGIESGSAHILKKIKKSITPDLIERQVKKVKTFGFYTQGFFIIGFPYERKGDIQETIDFALKLDLDAAFFGIFVPLPGAQDFEDLIKSGKASVETMDWDHMFSTQAQNFSNNLSSHEIDHLQRLATRKFYLRPRILLRSIMRIRGLTQFK
ncbi:MAG: hypothetical protein CW691_06265, partial [Candidatus Bathyarchaeum sp.]